MSAIRRALRLTLAAALAAPATLAAQTGRYHITKRINTGGEGAWAIFDLKTLAPSARAGVDANAFDPRTHKVYLSSAQYGETPAPTADRPRPRPPIIPGSFTILVLER
jgi:hypothetical protein